MQYIIRIYVNNKEKRKNETDLGIKYTQKTFRCH